MAYCVANHVKRICVAAVLTLPWPRLACYPKQHGWLRLVRLAGCTAPRLPAAGYAVSYFRYVPLNAAAALSHITLASYLE